MSYVVTPPAPVCLAIEGSEDLFPVGSIYCVGRNYADHAIEMGSDPDREPPFFFMKPAYAILQAGQMQYPAFSSDVHHEVELVVALGDGLCIYGYGVGVDMTRHDLQAEAKDKSRPWEAGKSFRHAAPCSKLLPVQQTGELNEGGIELLINGELRQQGNLNQMIWKVPEIIARLSELFVLQPGDLVFTGTPAGVGPVSIGDEIEARIEALPVLKFTVGSS